MWAGVSAEMEVFNLFSGHVRQEGLSRLERAKQRQSLVPDLRIAIQPQVGVGDGHREMHRLHDVLQFFETSLKNRIVKN